MGLPKQRINESDEDFARRVELARAYSREHARKRRADPAGRAALAAAQRKFKASNPSYVKRCRERDARKIALPEGHPGTCDLCGITPKPDSRGRRGLHQDHRHDNNVVRGFLCSRCNTQVGVLDLAFSDPDRFAALKAWSIREAPVVPVRSERPRQRRVQEPEPVLFDGVES